MSLDPSDIILAHDEYMRLLREYQTAKDNLEFDNSDENYDKLQAAMQPPYHHYQVVYHVIRDLMQVVSHPQTAAVLWSPRFSFCPPLSG